MDHLCSVCKRGTMRRSTRHGVKERLLWSLLGFFPWRCRMCKHRELLHDRGSEADLAMRSSTTASRPEF